MINFPKERVTKDRSKYVPTASPRSSVKSSENITSNGSGVLFFLLLLFVPAVLAGNEFDACIVPGGMFGDDDSARPSMLLWLLIPDPKLLLLLLLMLPLPVPNQPSSAKGVAVGTPSRLRKIG